MFEAEVEMEKRSSFLPLLLMLCLVAAILGLIGYVVLQAKGKHRLAHRKQIGSWPRRCRDQVRPSSTSAPDW